jgi:Transcriptional regulator, AbiEi antitoxin/Protein of unknown function (DUF559)
MGSPRLPESTRLAGILTTAELIQARITPADIRSLVKRGVLTKIDRGVYAQAGLAALVAGTLRGDRLLRVAAEIAIAGPGAVASHLDAVIVYGLPLLGRPPSAVSITFQRGQPGIASKRQSIRLCASSLPPQHVSRYGKVPVTSLARTVVDVARTSPFRVGVVVADAALRDRKTTKAELLGVLDSCRRWPGIERARQVVEFSDSRAESPFESISRVAFRDGGLPAPDLQVWLGNDDDQVIGRADFLWREHSTIGEADGALKYADPVQARKQLQRDADLRAAGYEVVHFTWRQIVSSPAQVIESVHAAFRRAAALRAKTAGSR